jgi:hypothetical protein
MKRIPIMVALFLVFCLSGFAQQTAADAPATKEDVQRYFDLVRSHDMMNKLMDAMSKPMRQLVHEQYMKDKDKLPADYESRMNQRMNDMWKNMPFDEMVQAMVPAYQKHFTKGDMDSLIAFYSSPTGQKVLRELPEVMSEAMGSMMPIMRKYADQVNRRVQADTDELLRESQQKNAAPVKN